MTHSAQPDPFAVLEGHSYMALTTYRKSGAAVTTPVWFARSDGKLYLTTLPHAGKAKRIRNNPAVEVAPCTVDGRLLGPAVKGTARILPAGQEEEVAQRALRRKYGLQYAILTFMRRLQRGQANRIYLEITPAEGGS
jgi:PPOX class probable F420-dependent enzyme